MLYWFVSCVRHCYMTEWSLNLQSNNQDFCFHGLWQLPSLYLAEPSSGRASSRELIVKSICPTPRLPKRGSYCFLNVLKRMCFPNRVSVAPWSLGSELIANSLCLTTPPGGESSLWARTGSGGSDLNLWMRGPWTLPAGNSVFFNMDCAPSFRVVEETDSPLSRDWRPGSPTTCLETSWEEQLLEQQEHLEKEMEEAKKMISGLQVAPSLVIRLPRTNWLLFLNHWCQLKINWLSFVWGQSWMGSLDRGSVTQGRQFLLCE